MVRRSFNNEKKERVIPTQQRVARFIPTGGVRERQRRNGAAGETKPTFIS